MHVDASGQEPARVYSRRFEADRETRGQMWAVLVEHWFQRFVPSGSTIVEIAAGHCEFINRIRAARRIAVDINPETRTWAEPGVEVVANRSSSLDAIGDAIADVVFISNFLEHIDKKEISATLLECRRILRPGGTVIVLQPNIRYVWRDYWMFFDHVTPLDDRSLCEALELSGFEVASCIARFLPYSTKSGPSSLARAFGAVAPVGFLVRIYLSLPILWRFFGGQALVVARNAARP